eukprot:CAMPEP_0115544088 /NCGR_PEP_ID=MMETSP0271-20121206/91908_1 /TAXON_ID=71861 /ORGANISM="Scrippsiella trochoidea, Strain CCMP3099" /LENGTH=53 /DNA_ID=CAMNT_0002977393 /DNA_START=216 /DNA_END=377 /DNA_ORIENTATION=+
MPDSEVPCAQSMLSVMPPPYRSLQTVLLKATTWPSCSNEGVEPPDESVPQPVM